MAVQRQSLSAGGDPDDALILASQAVASLTAQGVGSTSPPLGVSINPVPHPSTNQHIARSSMPLPSFNIAPLPYHGHPQNSAKTAELHVPAPQGSPQPQHGGSHDESELEVPGTNAQQATKDPQDTETLSTDAKIAEEEDDVSSDELSDVEMSEEPESGKSSDSEDDLDRLDKYVFNNASQAYEHGVPQHLTSGTTLFAERVIMGTSIYQHLESACEPGKSNPYPKLVPHELEMKRTPKAVECIWVGILPEVPEDDGDDAAEAQVNGKSSVPNKGQRKTKKARPIIDLEDDQLDIIPYDPTALRVVAKKQNKAVKLWHLYALTKSDQGSKLCQGWKVPFDDVFFFKAFRDDAVTGYLKRRHATDDKIKAVTFPRDPVPAVVSKSPTPSKHSTSSVDAPATPKGGSLPSPKASERKGKSSRTLSDAIAKQTSKDGDGLVQEGDQVESPADSVQGGNSPVADKQSPGEVEDNIIPVSNKQSPAAIEPRALNTANAATNKSALTVAVDDDGGEDAYPEYAVSSTSPTFKKFLDNMVRELSVVEREGTKLGQKRKRVAFDPSCDDAANTRRKTGGVCPRSNTHARDGEDAGAKPSSFVIQQQTEHLVLKLKGLVNKMAAKQDVAGLHQCVTMIGCIEERGSPSYTSALAPYLSISSKKDADPRACCRKLREILDLFPSLEDVDVDNHVLACMVNGLRLTGQSIDISLIEPCIKAFSRLYKQKFGETANHPTAMPQTDLVDMICQARDDAEKILKRATLNTARVAHSWVDPRNNTGSVNVD